MRTFFLLLLLTNIGLLAWQYEWAPSQDAPDERLAIAAAVPAEGLKLVSESQTANGPASKPPTPPTSPVTPPPKVTQAPAVPTPRPEPPKPQGQCFEVSGLMRAKDQLTVIPRLRKVGGMLYAQGARPVTKLNYRVLLPPASNGSAAERLAAVLEKRGVHDLFVIRSGDDANAISLGVFSSKESAEARRVEISKLGLGSHYVPTIKDLNIPANQYWLRLRWSGTPPARWQDELKSFPDAAAKRIDCPS